MKNLLPPEVALQIKDILKMMQNPIKVILFTST